MFGHQDHADGQHDANNHPEPQADATLGGQDTPVVTDGTPGTPPVSPPPSDDSTPDDSAGDFIMTDEQKPHNESKSIADNHTAPHGGGMDAPAADDELLELKQDALQQLSPLIDHLDQTPEEKFRTTMMMIQASDNQSLLKSAYEAAQNIEDEKARAQALLDVVNEINYFTQQGNDSSAAA